MLAIYAGNSRMFLHELKRNTVYPKPLRKAVSPCTHFQFHSNDYHLFHYNHVIFSQFSQRQGTSCFCASDPRTSLLLNQYEILTFLPRCFSVSNLLLTSSNPFLTFLASPSEVVCSSRTCLSRNLFNVFDFFFFQIQKFNKHTANLNGLC